jgi:hypothetical protein
LFDLVDKGKAGKTMKNSKRILSVTIQRLIDESPDTSYFGEYSDKKTSEYSIDRKHSLDCQINTHANDETIEKLERVISYLEKQRERDLSFVPCLGWAESIGEAQDLLTEKQDELAECDCDERGDMGRGEYRYFNPSFNYVDSSGKALQNSAGGDTLMPEEIRKYVKQDYERMERLNAGDWCYIGIKAKAEVQIAPKTVFRDPVVQTLHSGGLWGIESDSDASYFDEIEKEELSDLRDELTAIGFSRRAIATSFRNIERSFD